MKEGIVENLSFTFTPELNIQESDKGKDGWLSIGGTALVEGVSRNKNKYTFKNMEENDGKQFKWLFGHPQEAEKHVVGKGVLEIAEGKLMHKGEIRNTAEHPDVVESVKDGFLGPSIHATAKKVTRNEEGVYLMEGLQIDGVGLVAFQGVEKASIDYAIAESFDKKLIEMNESSEEEENDELKGDNMSEETKPEEVPQVETPSEEKPVEEPKPEEKPAEESVDLKAVLEEIKALREENKAIKEAMESKEEPVKEEAKDEEEVAESVAVVEEEVVEKEQEIVEHDKLLSVSEGSINKFNKALRESLRG